MEHRTCKDASYVDELERKIEERTQELQAANQELTAVNEDLSAANQHLFAMNEEVASLNENLEQRVKLRTTELQSALQALQDSERRFRLAMDFSGIGYLEVDLQKRTLRLSDNWRSRLGLNSPDEELPWESYLDLVHPEDAGKRQSSLDAYLNGAFDIHALEYRMKLPDNTWIWVMIGLKAIVDSSAAPIRLLGTISDITALRRRTEQERFRAEHDELTGLLNRQGVAAKVKEFIRSDQSFSVALVDIDDFEMINAVHGRDAGDRYLIGFASLLRSTMGSAAAIARYDGDEFLLLFPGKESAEFALRAFASMDSAWIATSDGGFFVYLSGGIAASSGVGGDLCSLVRQAALALKHAKEQGKRRVFLFEPGMQKNIERRQLIREQLNRALARNEHHLVFQPIFNVHRERHWQIGVEALLRWENPELGAVSPTEFIPVAETTGLILPLGKWVLEEACRFLVQWKQKRGRYLHVAVNVSALQLAQPGFCEMICEIIDRFGIPAEFLQLEVTETVLMTDMGKNAATLSRLRHCGFGISLDDFGVGYSSFTYLANLPVTTLKIDKSLTQGIADESDNKPRVLLQMLLRMADFLQCEVVVEGVETAAQLAAARSIGIQLVQGFYLGRPMPERHYLSEES